MGRYTKEPIDTASNDTKESASQESRNKIISYSSLTCGSLVTAKELDFGVIIMHRSFTEGGDSILSVLGALASEAATQVTSFVGS